MHKVKNDKVLGWVEDYKPFQHCILFCLELGWDVETCPWQGERVQLEKELKSESREDSQSTGLRQLPQALWWTAHCSYSCLIKPKSGVSTVIWDGWARQRTLTRICLSPGKWPWEVLFHLAAGNGILARRNLLLLPQFRISSPLPEHGFCTGNKERHPRLTQRVFQGRYNDAMMWNLFPVSHCGDTLSHSCLHSWEDQKNSTGN